MIILSEIKGLSLRKFLADISGMPIDRFDHRVEMGNSFLIPKDKFQCDKRIVISFEDNVQAVNVLVFKYYDIESYDDLNYIAKLNVNDSKVKNASKTNIDTDR